ncbi:MAG: hypothetical protein KF780_07975 [Sphingomonas sp.]|nr:hypothetical protein [Sphingomonas sp.]
MVALLLVVLSPILAAAALAGGPDIGCARNFTVGELSGLIAQFHDAETMAGGPIRYSIWRRDNALRMDWWEVRQDAPSLDRPSALQWEFVLATSARGPLWARIWGDGRYVGQVPMPDGSLRGPNGQQLRRLSVHDPGLLARLVESEIWEMEIVTAQGASLMRERIPAPPASALRASLAEQAAWLEGARETRPAAACHRVTDANEEV